jgi:putative ABC transport system ATP-binding protein
MQIRLQQVAPTFLEPARTAGSAVWDQNIAFIPGEKIQIVAPSGTGKTSLIHFLYGIRRDHNGNIFYGDRDIKKMNTEDFAEYRKNKISIVFQDLRLFGEQTVLQNLEVKRQLEPFHQTNKIEEMANRLGVGSRLGRTCKTCSYGEQQRIAIIRALQQPFEFLLLDEPFSHLDDNNRKLAMDLIEEEADLRKACIILADLKQTEFYHSEKILKL